MSDETKIRGSPLHFTWLIREHWKAAGPSMEGGGALLYAVDESANVRGSISVYDIVAQHRLIKTIHTVPGVGDVRGVAASAVTGKLYVAYMDVSGHRDGLLPEHLQRHYSLE